MIQYLKHSEIDKAKWDYCIASASNGLIYAESWFLDIVCTDGWDAVIVNDYQIVMPLPLRSKFGIRYIYTPNFVQQLGIIGNNISDELYLKIISTIPETVKVIDIKFNETNKFTSVVGPFYNLKNYKLSLNQPYDLIVEGFNRNCIRNIKKHDEGIYFDIITSPLLFANYIKTHLEKQINTLNSSSISTLVHLAKRCLELSKGEIIGVYDMNKELLATGLYFFSSNRLIFTVCASSSLGKEKQAMYKLVNFQIKKYAQVYDWYDFSGSGIKGVAYFNSTFGATPTDYYLLRINKLPRLLRWLKRN